MKPPSDIRLLIADVDGTLVPHDKVLSAATLAAAAELRLTGIGMALTSARPPMGMRMLIEPLSLDLPLAGFNGGLIVDPALKELESHPIPAGTIQPAIQFLKDVGLDVWIYTDTAWLVSGMDGPHVAREGWITKIDPKLMPDVADERLGRVFKIVGVSDDPSRLAAAEAATQQRLGGSASISRSEAHFLDITDTEANKGAVVRSLARRLGLDPGKIATIGDMPNDIFMFHESGFSIAMGNASDVVKASADVVTDSNEDDGFAKAVRRFLLPETVTEDRSPP
jgi:hypothetical protein